MNTNENKKIIRWFKDHTDTIVYMALGTYILFLGMTLSINIYLKITLILASIFYYWLGYYIYKEGVQ
jgi:hypothetical protein